MKSLTILPLLLSATPVMASGHEEAEMLGSLAVGFGTVFIGLLALLSSMYIVAALVAAPEKRKAAKAAQAAQAASAGLQVKSAQAAVGEGELAAIAMALYLHDRGLAAELDQRLTWSQMNKPFSPWVQDGKGTMHTHRINLHATSATGRIPRRSGESK